MTFVQIYRQSNSSLDQLRGNTLFTSMEFVQGSKRCLLNSGLKESIICMPTDFNQFPKQSVEYSASHFLFKKDHNQSQSNSDYVIQVEKTDVYGEFNLVLPKRLHKIRRRVLIWNELATIWNRIPKDNRIKGYILNGINGGFSVAIAGRIAFLPKSLKLKNAVVGVTNRKKWRTFCILNINNKLQNIVVKEVYENKAVVIAGQPLQRLKQKPIVALNPNYYS